MTGIAESMRDALLDEYDAVTDPTHRRVIDWALRNISGFQGRTPREYWTTWHPVDRMPPVIHRLGRGWWFERCCGERVDRFLVTPQRVTVTGVVKVEKTRAQVVTWCRVCGERVT